MIVPTGGPESPLKSASFAQDVQSEPQAGDTPPPYNEEPPASAPLIRASNYITISKPNGSIKGSYVIDPSMQGLTAFLPPLAPDETRKNLMLHSTNGCIKADISLPPMQSESSDLALLSLHSKNGSVSAELHRPYVTPPFSLDATSQNGAVNISLPRSFCGLVTMRTRNGSLRFSNDILAVRTLLSEIDGTCQCFVGNMSGVQLKDVDPVTWKGDRLVAESKNGSVRLQFDDEPPSPSFFTLLRKQIWG